MPRTAWLVSLFLLMFAPGRVLGVFYLEHADLHSDGRSKSSLTVVNVPDRTYVQMRFSSFKFFLSHFVLLGSFSFLLITNINIYKLIQTSPVCLGSSSRDNLLHYIFWHFFIKRRLHCIRCTPLCQAS